MSKTFVVFGATGQQGNSIIDYVLNDLELSQQYSIRAITRDVTSEKAKKLQGRVEVVCGDILDRPSIETALTGAHTVFINTAPLINPDVEYDTVKTIADIVVEKNAKYIIFSTLPSICELSGGRYTKVALHVSPNVEWPLINARKDTGKFVGAILSEPDKFAGKTFCGATKMYSMEEIIAIMSKSTGKDIAYKRISNDELKKRWNLPDGLVDMFMEMISFLDDTGYFGTDSRDLVAWAAKNARGTLSTLEEYFEAHPLRLE